jgi:hypothetical protein
MSRASFSVIGMAGIPVSGASAGASLTQRTNCPGAVRHNAADQAAPGERVQRGSHDPVRALNPGYCMAGPASHSHHNHAPLCLISLDNALARRSFRLAACG